MKPFSEIESRLSEMICPDCGTSALSATLRCDLGDRECLGVATCGHCGRQFDAETLPTHQERYEAVLAGARGEACPSCGGHDRTVRSMCDRLARQCFFLVSCGGCGDVRLA